MNPKIGSVWKTQLFPQNPKVARVVVLPWDRFTPISATRLNRVALTTDDGNPRSAHWWVSDNDLFPVDLPDEHCLVRPSRVSA